MMNFANAIFALELLELFYHYEGFLCHPVDQNLGHNSIYMEKSSMTLR
jgi:hypothetical protein